MVIYYFIGLYVVISQVLRVTCGYHLCFVDIYMQCYHFWESYVVISCFEDYMWSAVTFENYFF